jgi:hypothetical protein
LAAICGRCRPLAETLQEDGEFTPVAERLGCGEGFFGGQVIVDGRWNGGPGDLFKSASDQMQRPAVNTRIPAVSSPTAMPALPDCHDRTGTSTHPGC